MYDVLTVHEPLLVNMLGHLTGTLVFAIFLALLFRDRAGSRLLGSRLTLTAAGLAFLWNFASLLVIAWNAPSSPVSEVLVSISTVALSLLPSVLLHLSLGSRFPWLRRMGYAIAVLSASIHAAEVLVGAQQYHQLALRITTLGFGALTLLAVAMLLRSATPARGFPSRLAGTMALFLFSISFVHLGVTQPQSWPVELFGHHAGIALALFVLLQDYRFLLLDAFIRFLANILFAAAFVFACVSFAPPRDMLQWSAGSLFREGVLLASGCILLLLFSFLRGYLAHWLSVLVFPRHSTDTVLQDLHTHAMSVDEETAFLRSAAASVTRFMDAAAVEPAIYESATSVSASPTPSLVSDLPPADRENLERAGAEAVLPIMLTAGKAWFLVLGRRGGGRRYLSEDFEALARVQIEITAMLEQLREKELRRLVASAELRALQAQIHPHFLFNALNTLYGIIPREASGARKTVLNLADIFRYFLQTERTFLPLSDELEIIRAYLEIESLRLGSKLRTEISVPPEALSVPIPVLTVEPLVENAVKHGVASLTEGGVVSLKASLSNGALRIAVSDTGSGFDAASINGNGNGVGLENVTRRLKLCYGPDAALRIVTSPAGTTVEFEVPARQPETVLR